MSGSKQIPHRNGLTLIEVLIVISIVAILAALVIPKIARKVTGKYLDVVNTVLLIRTAERQWYNHKFLATLDNMYQGYYISGYERKRSNRDIKDFKVNSQEFGEICSQIKF